MSQYICTHSGLPGMAGNAASHRFSLFHKKENKHSNTWYLNKKLNWFYYVRKFHTACQLYYSHCVKIQIFNSGTIMSMWGKNDNHMHQK